ncbi:PstS family phosphate ABC transporter substrate-binding protein [Nannocystis pusilla]|uniref:PstS family phosphate ABC transporter substrate-binding protein n=1 Tax=Nannocystis pusilla TaxID=889268 RepID=UPI003BF56008
MEYTVAMAETADPRASASLAALWAAVLLGVAGVAILAAVFVAPLLAGSSDPPFLEGQVPKNSLLYQRSTPRPHGVLHLAGSGSNIPLTRALADAFVARSPDAHIVVFESIGSSGGVMAVYDDVVDLGLISRPLSEREALVGVDAIPYARVPVVVAVNLSVPDTAITTDELADIFAGRKTRWSDGAPITVLQRERGDSGHVAVAKALPAFAAADEAAYREHRWRVVLHDRAMQEALAITPGAVGLLDVGAISLQRLPLRALELDGYGPSEASVQSGRYPFSKDLAFAALEAPSGLAAEFIRFAHSDEGRALMKAHGYIPLPEVQ